MHEAVSAFEGFNPATARLLLVASTGGHLTQLVRFARGAGVFEHATWVTFDSPQSRSLLAGQRVVWVDYIAPRDVRGVTSARRLLERTLDPNAFDGVVSTGAAVAVAAFLWARKHSIPRRYIESVSRTDGPSLTGKITKALNLADTYTQHATWASPSWPRTHSVMRGYSREQRPAMPNLADPVTSPPLNVLVTLGTIRPYRFDRLVDRVLEITQPGDSVTWQLGSTGRDGLPGSVHESMSMESLLDTARNADVVITHSGVGTILQLCDEGISPLVIPRLKQHGEHVDDHQLQIWNLLVDAEVAHPLHVEGLTRESLLEAAAHRTLTKEIGE